LGGLNRLHRACHDQFHAQVTQRGTGPARITLGAGSGNRGLLTTLGRRM